MELSKELINEIIQFWQPYSEERLTEEDAKEIAQNLTNLFDFLNEEDLKLRKGGDKNVRCYCDENQKNR